jgi:hypothetical protein
MSYLGLQQSLDLYEKAGCPKDTLGQTVRNALTPRQRQTLLALLPRPSASRIHNALAAA